VKNIIIFGNGNHSKVVFSEILKLKEYNILGFIGTSTKKKLIIKYRNKKYFNLGTNKILKNYNNLYGVIGVGDNYVRKKIYKEIKILKKIKWAKIISKDSILNGNVKIGPGSIIISGSIINNGAKIGSHCIINTSSSIDHDNVFENFSSSGPSVTTGGNVKVCQFSHLGIGSTIKHGVTIGANTIIGGKSFVNKDCLKNKIYFGVPAKIFKNRKLGNTYL
jgi:acetyltransferase EpsM